MAVRIQFRRGTAAEWTAANPTLAAGEAGYETDTAKFKLGTGNTAWNSLAYAGVNQSDIEDAVEAVIGGAPGALDTLNELAAALDDDANFASTITNLISNHAITTTNVHGISNTANLVYENQLTSVSSQVDAEAERLDDHLLLTTNVHGISNTANLVYQSQFDAEIETLTTNKAPLDGPSFTGTVVLPSTTSIGDVSATEIGYLNNVTSAIQTQLNAKANIANAEFTGSTTLPADTSIGNVSAAEISYLNNVTSAIQTQLDGKLATSVASTTYAALDGATFTGTVSLTANTSIGSVDSTELGYLNGLTSSVQTQLDSKAPTADPTFTGTVSGVTKAHVGLGNVDNTSDANKPVSTATQTALDLKADLAGPTFSGNVSLPSTTTIGNVSATELSYVDGVTSAIQTQLDAKLNLSGGTLTGALTLSGAPTSDLHAATKQYVDGLAAGINFHQPVVAATTGNLAGTYNNGTNGVGATLTRASNGAIGTIDGATVSVGSRILLRAQTDKKENGVYTVTAVGSGSAPWVITRATDADNNPSGELANGDFVFTTSGSTNGSKGFIVSTTGTITIGTTEIEYAQFNASEAVIAGDGITKTGETISITANGVTSAMIADGTIMNGDINAAADIDQSKIKNLTSDLIAKAPTTAPTFTGLVTVAANGIAFTDGTQTKQGVPSITTIDARTASYTLSSLAERDSIIEISNTSATTLTIPADSTLNFPVGTTLDIIQTNTGQVTIANAVGVTVNATPGLKLRTRWSSATLLKRAANTWLVYGDLTA